MAVDEPSEILALTLIFVVHVAGGVMLIWAMLSGDAPGWRPRWWRGGGGPGGPPPDDSPPPLSPSPLPLDDSVPSRVRMRDRTPLRDAHPRPARRPSRAPQPTRSPQRR
ncbi:MAG: hypothetical protein ACR2LK_01325 [Solirubrobacteraceae bacterium]